MEILRFSASTRVWLTRRPDVWKFCTWIASKIRCSNTIHDAQLERHTVVCAQQQKAIVEGTPIICGR